LVLLVVIALAWLAVVTMVVAVCRAAARADAARDEQVVAEPICDGLVAWDRATAASLRGEWLPRAETRRLAEAAPASAHGADIRARRVSVKHSR
jgi:hypothetical protein